MSLLVAWIVFPLVLLALCAGLGLLVDVLSGRRLPGVLVAPAGLAAIVVVGQLTTLSDATAELTVPVLALLAVLGAGLSIPWRFGRPDPWPAAVALAVFAVFAAPVALSGEPTFAGYVMLDDTATWIAITDRVMEHGRSLEGLEPSTYRATLAAYPGDGYPIGVNLPWGAAWKLTGGDPAWLFQPYQAFLTATLALALWVVARPFLGGRRLRALCVFVASQAALFYGFSLWGGVKELAAAALIGLAAAALASAVRPLPAGARRGAAAGAVLPLGLAVAALAAVLSPAGLVWVAPLLAVGLAWAVRELGGRGALARAAWLVAIGALLSIPLFAVGRLTPPVENSVTSEAVLNLLQPLHPLQVFGIWPSGDFRLRPDDLTIAWLLAGLAAGLSAFGLYFALRDRAWTTAAYVGTSALGCLAIVAAASPWVDGKAMATLAPALLFAAMVGAAALYRRGLRVEGGVLLALLTAGVLWSNALAYGGVDLAPYDQLTELEQIGEDFAGQGPALMTEYESYGARHFLRELDAEGASELRVRPVTLRGGETAEKGESVDLDEIDLDALFAYRTLVVRRGPASSRPPLPYSLAWSGDYYEVWQRPLEPEGQRVLSHQPVGGEDDAGGLPNCSEVQGLGLLALSNQLGYPPQSIRLLAAPAAPVYDATGGSFAVPRAGRYEAWLKGSVRGSVELLVDGEEIGAARHELNRDEGFVHLGEARLAKGPHEAELRFGGADLHPGSGGFPRPETGPLLFAPAATEAGGEIVSVAPGEARELCGRRLDWIEAVGRG